MKLVLFVLSLAAPYLFAATEYCGVLSQNSDSNFLLTNVALPKSERERQVEIPHPTSSTYPGNKELVQSIFSLMRVGENYCVSGDPIVLRHRIILPLQSVRRAQLSDLEN